jgi:hypothetical protein
LPYFFQGETAETIAFFQDTLAFPQQSDRLFSLRAMAFFPQSDGLFPRNAIAFQKAGFVVGAIRESPLHYRSIPCFFFRERSPFFPQSDGLFPSERWPFSQKCDRFPKSGICCRGDSRIAPTLPLDPLFFFQRAIAFSFKERSPVFS